MPIVYKYDRYCSVSLAVLILHAEWIFAMLIFLQWGCAGGLMKVAADGLWDQQRTVFNSP